jgi:hypothetical protein
MLTDRVKTSCMEGMALKQTPDPHGEPAHHAVLFNRSHHVFRTGRIKAASGWQHRRYPSLIGTQDQQRELHRAITFPTARSISANGASSTARRGLSTMSQPGLAPARCRRNASRNRRLIRLRITAPPSALGTVRPSLVAPPAPSLERARQKATNSRSEKRAPLS